MKLVRLEVECFKCVQRAELELGPGLNVLYGPNDLGKTSLGDAVRAALLLQSTSAEGREYTPWGSAEIPRVRLAFEHREQLWRVEKRFAEGTRTYALLEHSRDGQVWTKAEERRGVDGELRKMLGWGVREPGGKGAPKGLPTSFLTTALLGRASELEAVFAADLGKDTDPSGRDRLAEALQTLAEDPLFKRMLTSAQQQVDAVKRADGSFSTKRDSPIVRIGERIKQLRDEHDQLMRAQQDSEAIEVAVRGHLDRRAALAEALEAARQRVVELEGLHAAGTRRREAAERTGRARARVDELDVLSARRSALADQTTALQAGIATAERAGAAAELELQAAATREREAEARFARANEDATAPTRAHEHALTERRLQLQAQHERAVGKRQAVIGALASEAEARASERTADDAHAALRRRELAHAEHTRALAQAEGRARELELAAAWWTWREAQGAADALERDAAEARALLAQARAQREAAERELAALAPLPDRAVLERLRGLEGRLHLAEHQAAVGFAVRFELRGGAKVTIAADGADATPLGDAREHTASRELVVGIDKLGTIAIAAGSAALRRELEDARTRWAADAIPVLAQHGVADTSALAERIATRERRTAELEDELREAGALQRQAERIAVDEPRLVAARARADQAETALGNVDRDVLARTASGLDGTTLAQTRTELARTLDGQRAELQREGTELAVERANAEHARTDASAARARADAALTGLVGDLGGLRAELDDEIAACSGELAAIDRELAGARASAEQAIAHAREAVEVARAVVERARLARTTGEGDVARQREQLAGCNALLRDADDRVAALDRAALVADAERLAAELAALPNADRIVELAELEDAREAVTVADAALVAATDELRKAEGRLDQLRGTGSPRAVERAREAIAVASASEDELRRDVEGWQLLRDTLRAVETEQGQHLGVALGQTIEQRLRRLTEGRYARLELDRDLRTAGLRAAGQPRPIDVLSEGLKEQLATLVRLAIAEHLRTMVLLDDHLAQTDPQRVDWFRDLLREVGSKVQIVVLTCRPRDYLDVRELPDATAVRDSDDGRVRAIDLARVITRST